MSYCPKTETCPLFNNNLLERQETADAYKNIYCSSSEKHKECVRYIIAQKHGKCADFIMPNSSFTIEEIENKMHEEGLI